MASLAAGPGPAPAAARAHVAQRLLGEFGGVVALCLAGAHFGLWFTPFVLGAATAAFKQRSRGVVLVTVAGAVAGWALALWLMALAPASLPVGATARSIAALAGLPPYAAVAITVTLLLAALQALAGSWLGRALFPSQLRLAPRRRSRRPRPPAKPVQPGEAEPAADPQE